MEKIEFSAILLFCSFSMIRCSFAEAQEIVRTDSTTHRKQEILSGVTVFGGIQTPGWENDINDSKVKPYLGIAINSPVSQNCLIPVEVFWWNIEDETMKRRWILRLSVSIKQRSVPYDHLIVYIQGGVGILFYMIPPFINLGVGLERRVTQSIMFVFDVRMLIFPPTRDPVKVSTPIVTIGINFNPKPATAETDE